MPIPIQSISASSRWLHCTASLQYNKDFKANPSTTKGNLIHEVSALRLREIFFSEDNSQQIEYLKTHDYVDKNDKTIVAKWDLDCEKTSDSYIQYATKMANQYKPHTIEIEKKINLTWYGYQKYGFIDLLMVSDDYTIIIDLKTGRTKVEADENSQMLMYAIGVIQEQMRKPEEDRFVGDYIIAINQSLIGNVMAYEYSLKEITRFYYKHREKMGEILEGKLTYNPSPSVCKYCDYRDKCSERIKKGVI